MRKTYKVQTEQPQGRELLREHNDCTVRAYANAFSLEYSEAHALLKLAGRKNRKGFHLNSFMKQMHPDLPAARMRMTLHKFINGEGKAGTWIVWIRRHVLCIRDGVALDLGMFPAGSRIIAVWKCDKGSWYAGSVQCKTEYEAFILEELFGKREYRKKG